jgi:hypothetical protein
MEIQLLKRKKDRLQRNTEAQLINKKWGTNYGEIWRLAQKRLEDQFLNRMEDQFLKRMVDQFL